MYPWIKLSWSPWKHSTPKKLKYSSVQTWGVPVVTVYQIGEQFGNTYKRAATCEIAANGCRTAGLFPCEKNVFRPHDFPLASEDTEAAPVNHPALVKISHHSVMLIFRRSLLLRLSLHQISALCHAWTYSQILVVEQ